MAGKITGYTSEICQQAMIEELEELFRDMKFNGQEGEKPLQIFKQFIPTPTDDDDDVALADIETHAVERLYLALVEMLFQVSDLYQNVVICLHGSSSFQNVRTAC